MSNTSRVHFWELMKLSEVDAINCAVDALTVSNAIGGEVNRIASRAFVSELANTLAGEFCDSYALKWHKIGTAKGWKKGSVGYASANNYNVCAVTGELSQKALSFVLDYDEDLKCTRVDLCVDLILKTPKPDYVKNVQERHPHRNDPEKLRMIVSGTGDTLYRNKRGGSNFGRVYDKSVAYGLPRGQAWRFEVQYGKMKAGRVLAGIGKYSGEVDNFIKSTVAEQFRTWDIPMPIIPDTYELPSLEISLNMVDTRFEWLKRCAPTIRALTNGREDEVREILNLPILA